MQFGFVIYLFRPTLFFLWSRQQTAWWSKQRSTCVWFKYIRAGVTFSRFYSTENASACCSSRQKLWWVYRKMLPVPIDTKLTISVPYYCFACTAPTTIAFLTIHQSTCMRMFLPSTSLPSKRSRPGWIGFHGLLLPNWFCLHCPLSVDKIVVCENGKII